MAIELITASDGEFQFKGTSYQMTADKNKLLFPYRKMVHDYGIILEMLPTDEQKQKLNQQIGNARFMKNRYLSDRKAYYDETKKNAFCILLQEKYTSKVERRTPVPPAVR